MRGKLKLFCRLSCRHALYFEVTQPLVELRASILASFPTLGESLEPLLDTMTDKRQDIFVLDNKNFEQYIKHGNKPQTQVCTELYKVTEERPGKPVKAGAV